MAEFLWNKSSNFKIKLNMCLFCDLAIRLHDIYSKIENMNLLHKKIPKRIFFVALFQMAQIWSRPRQSSPREQKNTLCSRLMFSSKNKRTSNKCNNASESQKHAVRSKRTRRMSETMESVRAWLCLQGQQSACLPFHRRWSRHGTPEPVREDFITHSVSSCWRISIFWSFVPKPNPHRTNMRWAKQQLHRERRGSLS